jgi:hypothetical protein
MVRNFFILKDAAMMDYKDMLYNLAAGIVVY